MRRNNFADLRLGLDYYSIQVKTTDMCAFLAMQVHLCTHTHTHLCGGSPALGPLVLLQQAAELVPQLGQRLASGQAQSHSFLLLQRHKENREQPQDSRRGMRDPDHNPQALKTWTQKAIKSNSSGDLSDITCEGFKWCKYEWDISVMLTTSYPAQFFSITSSRLVQNLRAGHCFTQETIIINFY